MKIEYTCPVGHVYLIHVVNSDVYTTSHVSTVTGTVDTRPIVNFFVVSRTPD
jgi:hypothetical protein